MLAGYEVRTKDNLVTRLLGLVRSLCERGGQRMYSRAIGMIAIHGAGGISNRHDDDVDSTSEALIF
jgi:hypothetical protein